MPPVAEIRYYFEGALRLAKGDAGGMSHFDFSVDGFWRSFWAIVIVAPGYAILVADQYARREAVVPFWPTVTAETLSYLLGWAILPILAIWLTRMFDLARRYVPLIVTLNWCSQVQIVLLLVPIALSVFLSTAMVEFLSLLATAAALFYLGFVIKTALDCTVGIAVTFLAADLVAVALLNGLIFSLVLG
jgi:hypothetical protein